MLSPGDSRSVLTDLYSDHHRWLRAWLYRQLNCPHDAADLTQDTFVRALTSRQLTALQEPRAFLTTIARNLLNNVFRRRMLERAYHEELAGLEPEFMPSEEDMALVREALELIDQLLDGLPNRARHCFLLHRLDGLTQPQIAHAMGISLATVERDLRRAFLHCLKTPQA